MLELTTGGGSFLVKDREGLFYIVHALLLSTGLLADPREIQTRLMKLEDVAQQYPALELFYDVVEGQIVLADIQRVDPAYEEVLLQRT